MDRMAIEKTKGQESEALRYKPRPDIIAKSSSGLAFRAVFDIPRKRHRDQANC
jgi:hypothetical protein